MKAPGNQRYRFSIRIDREQFLRYYQGTAGAVQVYTECGRRLRFPASRLRPFLTQNGIQGSFELLVDPENRFVNLKKLK